MPKKINLINQRFGKLLVLSKEKTVACQELIGIFSLHRKWGKVL